MKILFKFYLILYLHFLTYFHIYNSLLPFIFNLLCYIMFYTQNPIFDTLTQLIYMHNTTGAENVKELWTLPLTDYIYKQLFKETKLIHDLSTVDVIIAEKCYKSLTYYFEQYFRNKNEIALFIKDINWNEFYVNYIADTSENKMLFLTKITEDYLIHMQKIMNIYNDLITKDDLLEAKQIAKNHLINFSKLSDTTKKC